MKWNNLKLAARAVCACATVAALVVLATTSASAQTTGRLVGTIEDAQGAVLPGVTVTATSPQLQGANTTVTDGSGQFRFPSLPPGLYHVKAELVGFKPVEQTDVRIALDQTITLALKMQIAGLSEAVTVLGASPVIDTTSAAGGINAGQEMFAQLPVRRDFYSISRIAPGVTQDTYGAAVSGSTSAENQYIIDGLNTTGVEVGTQGKTLNFDFIQEVEVKTGGLGAEYGRMTGGAVNVITKSGGNAFHGDLFGFFEHAQASNIANNARSLLPLRRSSLGAFQSAEACSAVSQFPRRIPTFFTPLTRRIPAERSGLSSPQSAASYARRRTTPSRRLIVPGARFRDSKCIR